MKTLTYTLTIKENKLRLLHSLHVFIILITNAIFTFISNMGRILWQTQLPRLSTRVTFYQKLSFISSKTTNKILFTITHFSMHNH